jgi:hypothetical protein
MNECRWKVGIVSWFGDFVGKNFKNLKKIVLRNSKFKLFSSFRIKISYFFNFDPFVFNFNVEQDVTTTLSTKISKFHFF